MRKERIEMRFDGQMEDMFEMRVVEVCEYAEKVFVYVFGRVGE